jgi:hypothetical protein
MVLSTHPDTAAPPPPPPQLDPPAEACSLDEVASGAVRGDVLVNTTSVGMHPQVGWGWGGIGG